MSLYIVSRFLKVLHYGFELCDGLIRHSDLRFGLGHGPCQLCDLLPQADGGHHAGHKEGACGFEYRGIGTHKEPNDAQGKPCSEY
jgi:hypothetical protein